MSEQREMFTTPAVTEPPAKALSPAPANSNDDDGHFWRDNKESVILNMQPETAVYTNPAGGIVIRQEAYGYQDEDPYVFFSTPEAARKVVAAILRELGDA